MNTTQKAYEILEYEFTHNNVELSDDWTVIVDSMLKNETMKLLEKYFPGCVEWDIDVISLVINEETDEYCTIEFNAMEYTKETNETAEAWEELQRESFHW